MFTSHLIYCYRPSLHTFLIPRKSFFNHRRLAWRKKCVLLIKNTQLRIHCKNVQWIRFYSKEILNEYTYVAWSFLREAEASGKKKWLWSLFSTMLNLHFSFFLPFWSFRQSYGQLSIGLRMKSSSEGYEATKSDYDLLFVDILNYSLTWVSDMMKFLF